MQEELDTNTPNIDSPMPERVRRLAGRIKEKYDSEEFQAFWQPAKSAILRGDESGIRKWAEDRTGVKLKAVLRVHLSRKNLGEVTPAETWDRVDNWGARSQGSTKAQNNERRFPKIRRGIRKDNGLYRDLNVLASGDQTPEQVLGVYIRSTMYEAEEESDAELVRKITERVRRDAFEKQKTRREELLALAVFAQREHDALLRRAKEAGLPPREFEVYRLFIENPGIKNREVAARLGITTGAVGAFKARIKKTLNAT
jgi:DNA-binding CsgD family transcriptional regulator